MRDPTTDHYYLGKSLLPTIDYVGSTYSWGSTSSPSTGSTTARNPQLSLSSPALESSSPFGAITPAIGLNGHPLVGAGWLARARERSFSLCLFFINFGFD